jgi:hypothetical protein
VPNYGNAPYEESAFRSALRLLASGARGAVAAPAQGGLAGGFFTGFDASARASDAATQAAQAYAMKQQEQQDKQLHQEMQRKFMEAQIERQSAPPKPEKKEVWQMTPEEQESFYQHQERLEGIKAKFKPTKGTAGGKPKPPKPMTFPRRIPAKVTEQSVIDAINQSTDTELLSAYMTGRGGADSREIRRAAQLRLNDMARDAR